jgi:hypothetical protein
MRYAQVQRSMMSCWPLRPSVAQGGSLVLLQFEPVGSQYPIFALVYSMSDIEQLVLQLNGHSRSPQGTVIGPCRQLE